MCERLNAHLECGDSVNLYNLDAKPTPICLASPVSGIVLPMSEIPDPAFSSGCYGDCVAVQTEDHIVCAPCDGKIVAVASAKHGFGILNDQNGEIAIQVGIGTDKLCGEGFVTFVREGDFVEAGDRICQFDANLMRQEGYPPLVILFKLED